MNKYANWIEVQIDGCGILINLDYVYAIVPVKAKESEFYKHPFKTKMCLLPSTNDDPDSENYYCVDHTISEIMRKIKHI